MAPDTDEPHYQEDVCLAIVGSTGQQCGASDPPLCGTHEKSRSVTRVDEFASGPDETLRDELIEECEMRGETAYVLATVTDDIQVLWRILTACEPITLGGEEWSARKLRLKAEQVAKHPDLDVDDHLFANGDCIAVLEDGQYGDEYRCTTSAHGNLLCGLHDGANDLRTVFDEDWDERPGINDVWINGQKHWLVEQRTEDAIVVTPDYEIERYKNPTLETANGLPIEHNGWQLRERTGEQRRYEARGRIEYITAHRNSDGVDIVATNATTRVVFERVDAWDDALEALVEIITDYDPESIAEILDGDAPDAVLEQTNFSKRPPLLTDVDEDDSVTVSLEGQDEVYKGTVTDIGTGSWETPVDEIDLTVFVDEVAHDGTTGMLTLESTRTSHDRWTNVRARFDDEFPSQEQEELGIVADVDAGRDRTTGDGGEVTFQCEDCGNVVEAAMSTSTCINCGGTLSPADEVAEEPQPSEQWPKYLREGLPAQDVETLREIATYCEALADSRVQAAERELEEAATEEDEVPEAWDENEWEETVEDAREQAEISETKGTLTVKTIDDRDYYYLQWRKGSKIKSKYVAPVVPTDGEEI